MALPYMVGAVRQALILSPAITVPNDRISTRAPDQVADPFIIVRVVSNVAVSAEVEAYSPLLHVRVQCAESATGDPETITHDIAAAAQTLLARLPVTEYQGSYFTTRVTDGAQPLPVDDTRGIPVFGSYLGVELLVHA